MPADTPILAPAAVRPAMPQLPIFERGFGPIREQEARETIGAGLHHAHAQFLADVEAVGDAPDFFAQMGQLARGRG